MQNDLTDAGAFTNSASYDGTFDQSGSGYEWNDPDGTAGPIRGRRTGYRGGDAMTVSSSIGYTGNPSLEGNFMGFRLAILVNAVPEPSTYAMALAGLACGGFSMGRRRKRV